MQSNAENVPEPDFGLTPDVAKTSWKKYLRESVFPSSMADYWYCQAKIVNMQLYGSIETRETTKGTEYHEEVTAEIIKQLGPLKKAKIETLLDVMKHSHGNISRALADRRVLANSEDTILFRAVAPELRIAGTPDKADCRSGGEPILMDFKTTSKLPADAWASNRIQLGAYMIGVERLGFKQSYGVLSYVQRSDTSQHREFRVYLDSYLREEVATTAEAVRGILTSGTLQPTSNPRKCAACQYVDQCQWSLPRT